MNLLDFAKDYTKNYPPKERAAILDFVDKWEDYEKSVIQEVADAFAKIDKDINSTPYMEVKEQPRGIGKTSKFKEKLKEMMDKQTTTNNKKK